MSRPSPSSDLKDLASSRLDHLRSPIHAVEYCKKHVEAANLLYTACVRKCHLKSPPKSKFKISPKIKAPSLKFSWYRNREPRRVVRRRVRKTAVSSATLIEEFDSFLGEYFLVPVSIYECFPRFLVSSCLAAVFEKIWSKMKMGFRVFVGFVHELLLFLRKNLIENENGFFFFGSLLYTACVLGQCFFLFDF